MTGAVPHPVRDVDYEAIAARAFDEPLGADDRAALAVWADALDDVGDPRGALIALEHALDAERDARRARAIRHAMIEHLATHGGAWIGGLGPTLGHPRALDLDVRAGQVYGASLDTRHVAAATQRMPEDLVAELLSAPMTAGLRRLHVRVRKATQVPRVIDALARAIRPPPLEQLAVTTAVQSRGRSGRAAPIANGAALVVPYPALWSFCMHGALSPFPMPPPRRSDAVPTRVELGRELLYGAPQSSSRALAAIVAQGARAFMFVEALCVLLQSRDAAELGAVALALPALGPRARLALPLLATITSRPRLFSIETRRAAGVAIARIRAL